MKRRKSSPPDDTATDESVSSSLCMAFVMFSRRPRIVSPREGQASFTYASHILKHLPENKTKLTLIPLEEFKQ